MKSRKKTKAKAKKAGGKKLASRKLAAARDRADPPLSAREAARVRASTRNIREGKYKDFSSVDRMWEYAESEATPASA